MHLPAAALQGSEAVLAGRQTLFTLEYPCNAPDSERWFELYVTPLQGAVKGMVFGHREITARKLDQRALEQCSAELPYHERDLHAVLNSVSSMIGYWDRTLRNRFANHAYRDWFGVDPATIPGKHIREVIGEERYRLNLPYIEAALSGVSWMRPRFAFGRRRRHEAWGVVASPWSPRRLACRARRFMRV
jgi:PAS domain-containing protein